MENQSDKKMKLESIIRPKKGKLISMLSPDYN